MKIKDIKPDQKKIVTRGKVIEKSTIKELKDNKVFNILLEDDTGRCDTAIYESCCKDFDKIKEGDMLLIINAMSSIKEDGSLKLSTGKYARVYIR